MSSYTCNWGILATGGIAATFSADLLVAPSTRDVSDVSHRIVAVASSTSSKRAEEFVAKLDFSAQGDVAKPKCYGSYEELVKDADVDIVYVATPHSHHYENVLLCLENGKNVCCEKPFTINAAQARHLVKVAKEKNLFLMEAMWIRFFPIVHEIQRLLHKERVLGKLIRAQSDFGVHFDKDPKHRLLNPELGGGALLDLGIYPLTWQMLTLFEDPDNKRTPPIVASSMLKTPLTGVDELTTLVLNFEEAHTQGIATCNMSVRTHPTHTTLVQGEKGDLTVSWGPHRPESFTLHLRKDESSLHEPKQTKFDIPGHGMFWEADACARALRDGKKEAELCPLSTTLLTMEIMDGVRQRADFRYPEKLEATREDA